MSGDVKARLAAAGWSDRTRGGGEILEFMPDGCGDFVGLVKCESVIWPTQWGPDGVENGANQSVGRTLVPLPAPVAVQDEQPANKSEISDKRLAEMAERGVTVNSSFLEWKFVARELIAARKRIAELEARLQCPPVQTLATSGPSITRPVGLLDEWVTFGNGDRAYKVTDVDVDAPFPMAICGTFAIRLEDLRHTGPTHRGPWRPIQKGGAE